MAYSIIIPNKPIQSEKVHVRDYYLGKNKLWAVNDGELLLHYTEGSDSFFNEIGIVEFGGKVKYLKYTDTEMKEIFKYYFLTGELLTVHFHSDFNDDYEVDDFFHKIRFKTVKTNEEADNMTKLYEYLVENITGNPWYFTIIKNGMQIYLYQTSSVFVCARGRSGNEEETAFLVYAEIFNLLNRKLVLSKIEILEKEKKSHPMKNAHKLLLSLLQSKGKDTATQLGIANEEYEYIKNELIKYTKELETKKIYK